MSFLLSIKIVDVFFTPTKYYRTEVFPCQFLDVKNFSECLDIQLAPVMMNGGWTYINKNGDQIVNKK